MTEPGCEKRQHFLKSHFLVAFLGSFQLFGLHVQLNSFNGELTGFKIFLYICQSGTTLQVSALSFRKPNVLFFMSYSHERIVNTVKNVNT